MSGYTVRNCGNYAHLIDDCANVTLVDNINDYVTDDRYPTQVMDLLDHGCRIDVIGSQMHLFKPNESANIAAGEGPKFLTPDGLDATFRGFRGRYRLAWKDADGNEVSKLVDVE